MTERRWQLMAVVTLVVALAAFLSVDRVEGWPNPDAPSYTQLADGLASGSGYSVNIEGEPEGSRYPPGLPSLLALMSPIADAGLATLVLAAVFVVAVWASAWKAGGPVAAAVAVLLLAMYLPRHKFAGAVMADVTGALFVVSPLLALQFGRVRLAGVLAGFCAWVKLLNVVVGAGLPRRALPPFFALLGGLIVTKLLWGWGYRSGDAQWEIAHIVSTDGLLSPEIEQYPNVLAYPLMLLGLHASVTAPFAAVLAGWAVWKRPERRYVLATAAGILAVCVPYFYQADRFLFPIAALVAIYTGVGVVDLVRRWLPADCVPAAPALASRGVVEVATRSPAGWGGPSHDPG